MHGAEKRELRETLNRARRARSETEIELARAAVRDAVLGRCATAGWRCVAAYVPLRTEPGSLGLLDALTAHSVRVLVPVVQADRDLDWAVWDAVEQTPQGVHAIAAADAVLVPALAVAADGTRLGRGGGSYDRALPRARRGIPIAALLFETETVDTLPSDPWDVAVTAVVTPSGWRDVSGDASG